MAPVCVAPSASHSFEKFVRYATMNRDFTALYEPLYICMYKRTRLRGDVCVPMSIGMILLLRAFFKRDTRVSARARECARQLWPKTGEFYRFLFA